VGERGGGGGGPSSRVCGAKRNAFPDPPYRRAGNGLLSRETSQMTAAAGRHFIEG